MISELVASGKKKKKNREEEKNKHKSEFKARYKSPASDV